MNKAHTAENNRLERDENIIPGQNKELSVGMDIGSTTAKIAITRGGEVLYSRYERHYSKVRSKILEMLRDAQDILGERGEG